MCQKLLCVSSLWCLPIE
uniref:Uncharacterized protein n=1 Tax=Rhizophora mucronata TaxID=61149 RepID=A0A2P2PSE1_RHIMU